MYKVYRHIGPTGNVYIGITRRQDVRRRFERGAGYKNNPHFYRAIQKYGWDNFKHEILFENLSKERACALEISLIRHYKNLGISYNISDGGESGFSGVQTTIRTGWHHSEETRKKISERRKGIPSPFKGQKRAPEIGQKVSNTKKGIATRGTGWHHSEETRKKMSQTSTGKIPSEMSRKKMSESRKKYYQNGGKVWNEGLPFSDETKLKMSERRKQYYRNHDIKWVHKILDSGELKRTRIQSMDVEKYVADGWKLGKYPGGKRV